jgi:hypothetical protein
MKKKVKALPIKTQLFNLQSCHNAIAELVKKYVGQLRDIKITVALTLPAYGNPGEPNEPGKSQPNVVFVKDLITQVHTAGRLGYDTHLIADGSALSVLFVEKTPQMPALLQGL